MDIVDGGGKMWEDWRRVSYLIRCDFSPTPLLTYWRTEGQDEHTCKSSTWVAWMAFPVEFCSSAAVGLCGRTKNREWGSHIATARSSSLWTRPEGASEKRTEERGGTWWDKKFLKVFVMRADVFSLLGGRRPPPSAALVCLKSGVKGQDSIACNQCIRNLNNHRKREDS